SRSISFYSHSVMYQGRKPGTPGGGGAGRGPPRGVQDARVRTRSYLRRVASPPRRCRSALFFSSTCLTRRAISRLMRGSRSVRSLWTVLLLTPKTTAAWRTVAWELRMYVPRSTTRLRMYSFIAGPPRPDLKEYIRKRGVDLGAYFLIPQATVRSQRHHPLARVLLQRGA